MLQNKKFQNNDNLETVTIVGENGIFYNLSNGANIKKDIFFQRYSELISDPSSFFTSQAATNLQSLAEQLKTVDTTKLPNGDIPSQVVYKQPSLSEQVTAPPEYRDMLQKSRLWDEHHRDLSDYKVYDNDEDAAADFDRKFLSQQQQVRKQNYPQQPQYSEGESQQYESELEKSNVSQTPKFVSPEEEAFRFFKSFKKVYPITLVVNFEDKIAQPDFIKLMAVNYEGDIIKFYTKEFMNRIYNDPGFLENKIYEKLKEIVFSESQQKEKKPRTPRTPKVIVKDKPAPRRASKTKVSKKNNEIDG